MEDNHKSVSKLAHFIQKCLEKHNTILIISICIGESHFQRRNIKSLQNVRNPLYMKGRLYLFAIIKDCSVK